MLLGLLTSAAALVAHALGAKEQLAKQGSTVRYFAAGANSVLGNFAQGRFAAITFGECVTFASYEAYLDPNIRRHELIHVAQWRRVGVLVFSWNYLRDYTRGRLKGLKHFEAYREIRYEAEAYLCEHDKRFPSLM